MELSKYVELTLNGIVAGQKAAREKHPGSYPDSLDTLRVAFDLIVVAEKDGSVHAMGYVARENNTIDSSRVKFDVSIKL